MVRTIFLLLLVAAFLGGYYVGRLPGAPDIINWAEQASKQVSQAADKAADTIAKAPTPLVTEPKRTAGALVEVAGTLYRIGGPLTMKVKGGPSAEPR